MHYYVNLFGDDSNLGTSETAPWQTIERVNAAQLLPGDSVLFHANQTFLGNLCFADKHIGRVNKPITVGSYGFGRATIDAQDGAGCIVKDMGGIHLRELNFVGAGASENTDSGIRFINTLPGGIQFGDIRIHRVDVSGFKHSGICFMAEPPDRSWSGFCDVKITNVTSHDNGDAGISCIGVWKPEREGYAHANFYVGNCSVYRNAGIPGKGSHSGNGIVLAQVDGALIEHCRAYENGSLNDYEGGGPVGIWVWDANRVVIQYNESHHNRAGSSKDGGGFDLDGGVRNSTTIFTTHSRDGNPVTLDCSSEGIRNIRFYNNRFQTDGKAVSIRGKTNPGVVFEANTFEDRR